MLNTTSLDNSFILIGKIRERVNYSLSLAAFLDDECCSSESFSPKHIVRTRIFVTAYGSQFADGRRSSK